MEGDPSHVLVTVLNETDVPLDVDRWADLVRGVLVAEGVDGGAETNVVFVDADEMASLNAEHMAATGPTDVLSFPIDDEPAGVGDAAAVRFVGDIVVCPSVAAANASSHAGTLDDEIALLLVHGSLHLLGHDHALPAERAAMWSAERRLLAALWGPLPRDPWVEAEGEVVR
jgi:probable rRNA maturation factor